MEKNRNKTKQEMRLFLENSYKKISQKFSITEIDEKEFNNLNFKNKEIKKLWLFYFSLKHFENGNLKLENLNNFFNEKEFIKNWNGKDINLFIANLGVHLDRNKKTIIDLWNDKIYTFNEINENSIIGIKIK